MRASRRDSTTAQTRALLVRSATECFVNEGYDRTSVEHLTGRVGVSKGAFYKHFPDKRAVFVEVFAGRLEVGADLIASAQRDLEPRPRGAGVRASMAAAGAFAQLTLTDPVHREFIRQAPEVLGASGVSALDDEYLLAPMVGLLECMERRDELVAGLPLNTVAALLIRMLCAGSIMVSTAANRETALIDELVSISALYQGILAPDLRS